MGRFIELSGQFLTQMNLDVEWHRWKNIVTDLVIERLKTQDENLEKKLAVFALETDVQKRLDMKSSKYDYGSVFKEIAGLKVSLAPLISNEHTLKAFIDQVIKRESFEINTKDLNNRIDQVKCQIKDLAEKQNKEIDSFAHRCTSVESTIKALAEE
jgi:hypothetical protein